MHVIIRSNLSSQRWTPAKETPVVLTLLVTTSALTTPAPVPFVKRENLVKQVNALKRIHFNLFISIQLSGWRLADQINILKFQNDLKVVK